MLQQDLPGALVQIVQRALFRSLLFLVGAAFRRSVRREIIRQSLVLVLVGQSIPMRHNHGN